MLYESLIDIEIIYNDNLSDLENFELYVHYSMWQVLVKFNFNWNQSFALCESWYN